MRVGWKVRRLTKKELCLSNETWHALNSTFPDTKCIVSFPINPHWISNSGLWKIVLETFQNGLKNWRRESCFTRTMLLHTCHVIAMAALHDCGFELVDHLKYFPDLALSDYFLFPSVKKHLAGKQYLQYRIGVRATTGIQALQNWWKLYMCQFCQVVILWTWSSNMWIVDRRGDYVKNKPHLVKIDYYIIVSLWTFQPTLVVLSMNCINCWITLCYSLYFERMNMSNAHEHTFCS